jgi:hypothetical protein
MSKEMRKLMDKFKILLEDEQNYNQIEFNKEFLTEHKLTKNFIENKISEKEYIKELNLTINENILKNISETVIKKITQTLYTFLTNASKIGLKILEKLKTFINWILNLINSLNKDLAKIIKITLITMVFLITSASLANAQTNKTPINKEEINVAIGYLSKIKDSNPTDAFYNNQTIEKAMIYLIDMRDYDGKSLSETTLKIFGDNAIKLAKESIETSKNIKNTEYKDILINLMQDGSSYIGAKFSRTTNLQTGDKYIKDISFTKSK